MALERIDADRGVVRPLYGAAATRAIERAAAAQLPEHTLMARAGLAVARLGLALAPHARTAWIACGPGNNGGDGLEAAAWLQRRGKRVVVTLAAGDTAFPPDARRALEHARAAGVAFATEAPALQPGDLSIDALLGIGSARPVEGAMAQCLQVHRTTAAVRLAVDLPSGLDAETGILATEKIANNPALARCSSLFPSQNTLALLTLKPGLFTTAGRDAAGQVWFDDLGVEADAAAASATLLARPQDAPRLHASHKGSYGDVAVIGGAPGMAGAALLAARAALHGGAGRVFVALLDASAPAFDAGEPALMLREAGTLELQEMAVVCGCGGGDAIRAQLPKVLSTAARLVIDADALNAIAGDASLQQLLRSRAARRPDTTVLTPHPLEAARLLGSATSDVQADRLRAARELAQRFACVVVLKGSGTVIAAPGCVPAINPTGNALLATAGTGDVLAGMIGSRLAGGAAAFDAACGAVWQHGFAADRWPADEALTASHLAAR